mgnify:CR=1 FL=1
MSRIGKKVIDIPSGIEVEQNKSTLKVKGLKGEMSIDLPRNIQINIDESTNPKTLSISIPAENKPNKMLQGTYRSHINNMITGLSKGFTKKLEIIGVGYRAAASGKKLTLQIGYTHPVEFEVPDGVTVETPQPTEIIISGYDKHRIGQFAADIRKQRPPEPYKGKGIKYSDEIVKRKVGKTAVGGEA